MIRLQTPEWISHSSWSGTVPGGSSQEVVFTFDATWLSPGDYSADVTIYSNDPNEPELIVPISLSVFSEETSYMYAEDQQVPRGSDAPIPLNVHASDVDDIVGIAFALSIQPIGEDVPAINEDLGYTVNMEGGDVMIQQTGPGQASFYLSNFDWSIFNYILSINMHSIGKLF